MSYGKKKLLATMAGIVVTAALTAPSMGIIVSEDPAKHLVSSSSELNMGGWLSNSTSAVLIDPWHVLTAKHVVSGFGTLKFTMNLPDGTKTYTEAERFLHPTADLAVLRLSQSTGLPGYGLYTGTDEAGKTAIIAGIGVSGIGSADASKYPRGVYRYGSNRVDTASANSLTLDFDALGTTGTFGSLGASLEAMTALGDSGGPLWIRDPKGNLLVAGIHNSVSGSSWGSYFVDTRVSTYATWINDILSKYSDPTPPPPPPPLAGDANLDGRVDIADFGILRTNLGMSKGGTWAMGDFTGDGKVDIADFGILRSNLGATSPATVPEPATMTLLAMGASALLIRRRARSN